MAFDFLFVLAVGLSFSAYAVYLHGLRNERVQPNRASWLIWSAATALEALTYAAVNPGAPQGWVFAVSAVACIVVTLALFRRSHWAMPSQSEAFCIFACISALVIWLVFREAFWAHMLVVAAVPVSFWPTWASAWRDRGRERSPAWGLWTLGDLATLLIAVRMPNPGVDELSYVIVEFLCHASVWLMIGIATISPIRMLTGGRARITLPRLRRNPASFFYVEETHLGKAVFAAEHFAESAVLMEFTGRRIPVDQVPTLFRGEEDRFVQVTPDHYMGPSGRIDDLVNHSCAPNAGLRFTDDGVFLVATRAIVPGEEVTWDYSTTLRESNWHMICQCRAVDCRRVIGNFETLAPDRQEWFRARNLVAPYLRRSDPVTASRRKAS